MIRSAQWARFCWSCLAYRGESLPRRSNVFRLSYRRRMAEDARTRFKQVAERRGRVTDELWQEVRVSDDEFARARLTPKDI